LILVTRKVVRSGGEGDKWWGDRLICDKGTNLYSPSGLTID
jgi:hypothetical protein